MSNYTPGAPGGVFGFFQKVENSFKATGLQVRKARVNETQAEIDYEKTKLKIAEGFAAEKQAAIVAYKKAQTPKLKPEGSGTPNATQAQYLATLDAQKAVYTKQITTAKAKIVTLTATLKSLQQDLAKFTKPTGVVIETPDTSGAGDADKLIYKYNLPMLKAAYLNPFGPQGSSLVDRALIGAPINEFTNARLAWKGVKPARGTLQMSKVFAANALAKPKKLAKGQKRNEQPYGFRFLYNPTEISMAWGIVDAFSPEYVQSDSAGMSGVAVGLMKGTIAFSLLLNRISDVNMLQEDGSYHAGMSGNDMDYDFYSYSQVLYPAVGTQVVPVIPTPPLNSPYGLSEEPSFEERATIWKKGTMYDIEYLFRAMGGFYADYESGLNGQTADRGWLQPIPMELHLGTGLRYLVRVSSLDLKHMMFNERMVPTLTTVNVVCTRYYDSPDAFKDPTVFSPEKKPD
jgi:hypothetical protein